MCSHCRRYCGDFCGSWKCVGKQHQGVGCEVVSCIAGGTFPLDCFGLGFKVGLRIEMVIALNLSVADVILGK